MNDIEPMTHVDIRVVYSPTQPLSSFYAGKTYPRSDVKL